LQGERSFAKDNKSLGIFKLAGIPSAPRGVPKINVTFQLDVNGLLSVSAREEQSGQEQSIKIEGASVLAREEVSKMIEEAEKNAAFDKSKKALVNIIYEYDNLLCKAEALTNTIEFTNTTNENVRTFFTEVIKSLKINYKMTNFNQLATEGLDDFDYACRVLFIDLLTKKIGKKSNFSNSSVIDVTDDAIDV
jgi:molecular chaperone DnaK (HSP70)